MGKYAEDLPGGLHTQRLLPQWEPDTLGGGARRAQVQAQPGQPSRLASQS